MSRPDRSPAEHAQAQLDAYNAHDLEAFLACYAEDVEVFDFPSGALKLSGRAAMGERYGPMFREGKVHAALVHRMVQGAVAIDEERVTGLREEPLSAIAMYEIEGSAIRRVWFVRER